MCAANKLIAMTIYKLFKQQQTMDVLFLSFSLALALLVIHSFLIRKTYFLDDVARLDAELVWHLKHNTCYTYHGCLKLFFIEQEQLDLPDPLCGAILFCVYMQPVCIQSGRFISFYHGQSLWVVTVCKMRRTKKNGNKIRTKRKESIKQKKTRRTALQHLSHSIVCMWCTNEQKKSSSNCGSISSLSIRNGYIYIE